MDPYKIYNKWRLVYAVSEEERTVSILAVRKRPPYDYQDLLDLLTGNTSNEADYSDSE